MQRNRIGRYFANQRTTEITQAARDFRWLRWLARPESKMLRTHLLEGLPLELFSAECRVANRLRDMAPTLTREESAFVFGP